MSGNLENNICQAIDILVSNAVEKAGYDRTIRATVIKSIDESIHKYQCKYQDSTFYAYGEPDVIYPDKTEVYVLIPNNDFTSDNKKIVGTVKKLGVDYLGEGDIENWYDKNGLDLFENKGEFSLSSYKEADEKILYDRSKGIDLIGLNIDNAYEYLNQSSSIILGFKVRTNLPVEQQTRGDYGVIVSMIYRSDGNDEEITKNIILDVNKMVGNPYRLFTAVDQKEFYDVTPNKFVRIESVLIYAKGFPNTKDNMKDDIFISDIALYGANRMTQSEINGYSMSFITPNGTFFRSKDDKPKKVTAQVKIKGKVADSTVQELKFYWFKNDMRVSSQSEGYNKIGGIGWRCLNPYSVIKPEFEGQSAVVEWSPLGDTIEIKYKDAKARENQFKCVVQSGTTTFSKTLVIKNLDYAGVPEIIIKSSQGTDFESDVGNTNLTCEVVGQDPDKYTYSWGIQDKDGYTTLLPETTEINQKINEINDRLHEIARIIAEGTGFLEGYENEMSQLLDELKILQSKQRVVGNTVYSVDLTKFTQQAVFKCSVFDEDSDLCGTAQITLTNKNNSVKGYQLNIVNGTQLFKYDVEGIAPTNQSNNNPLVIKALGIQMFDENGNEIPESVIKTCDVSWRVPIKETLLKVDLAGVPDEDQKYITIKGEHMIVYSIATRYNRDYDKNDIELSLKYKNGITYTARTNFTFLKEGESGTIGNKYTCKISTWGSGDSSIPSFPTYIFNGIGTSTVGELDFLSGSNKNNITVYDESFPVQVSLWKDGNKIFEGNTTEEGISYEGKPIVVTWKFLGNRYSATSSDRGIYNVDATTGGLTVNADALREFKETDFSQLKNKYSYANLLECTVSFDGFTLHDVIPIGTLIKYNNNYTSFFRRNTGYLRVTYTSDGRRPQYDHQSFVFETYKNIDNTMVNVGMVSPESEHKATFDWLTMGTINQKTGTQYYPYQCELLTINENNKLADYEKEINPVDLYDGQCVTNGIVVESKNSFGFPVTRYFLPIYLHLNKYGLGAINDWDGNSVQLDKDGGYIFSPQIGAGTKDEENRFSGVLMGKVKESDRTTVDSGVLGYNKGSRTFFLDADDGSLSLGKQGSGKIIIDPSSNKSLIYSQDYWKSYNEKGMPSSYLSSNENKQGMLIDLTAPEIKFGSGNFSVDSNGGMVAKGGGEIAGWKIGETSLSKNTVGMSSDNSESTNKAFWAGGTSPRNALFSVDFNGALKSTSGTIGGWTIDENKLYNSTVGMSSSNSGGNKAFWSGSEHPDQAPFSVDFNGNLVAKNGDIGGWVIGNSEDTHPHGHYPAIMSKSMKGVIKNSYDSNAPGIILRSDGYLCIGDCFRVRQDGYMTATSGKIGGWNIGESSLSNQNITLDGKNGTISTPFFTINNSGKITAKGGTVGGWTITSETITGGNIVLEKSGNIKCITANGNTPVWQLSNDGTISAGGATFSSDNKTKLPDGNTFVGNTTLAKYVGDIVANSIRAGRINVGRLIQMPQGDDVTKDIDNGADFYGTVNFFGDIVIPAGGTGKTVGLLINNTRSMSFHRGIFTGATLNNGNKV